MLKWSKNFKIAFLISIFLHASLFVFMKGASLYSTFSDIPKALGVDLVEVPPDESLLPTMFNKKIEIMERDQKPLKRITITKTDISNNEFYPTEVPKRQMNFTIQPRNNPALPLAVPDISEKGLYSNSPSISSSSDPFQKNTLRGDGIGRGLESSGLSSGKSIADSGKIIKTQERNIKPKDNVVREKLQIYTDAEMPFVKAFQEIGKNIVSRNQKKIDVTFIIDISESMEDDIEYVRRHLNWMIESFREANLDFTLGVVTFHYNKLFDWLGTDVEITKQTHDVEEIRDVLRAIKVSGGERPLDALMRAFKKVKFRSGAARHFIFITDEYVKGTYSASDVLKEAKRSKVIVDVIGVDEPFQRAIAEQTGGIWMPIEAIKNN
ncbi:TPA: VWA domain-containing protein [Candidatus Poribacteria bacterium]|nr:VWA domain-containing protein [Candidatus Poribacteria bacterium]